jgi:acyl-CoA synthetase (AMP-forming)/AMP-acid ligase II
MNYEQMGKHIAKMELQTGNKIIESVKEVLKDLHHDDNMESFLDSYLNYRVNNGEPEKEAKNYRSRVKAILKNWKDPEKKQALLDYKTNSVQLFAKYARDLNKVEKPETESEPDTKQEKLLSIGDISAELDRLAQHLQAHGLLDQGERIMVISNEILEPVMEPATI